MRGICVTIDLEKLDAALASVGSTRKDMEAIIGRVIAADSPDEVKFEIWRIMKDARVQASRFLKSFPDATVTGIRPVGGYSKDDATAVTKVATAPPSSPQRPRGTPRGTRRT